MGFFLQVPEHDQLILADVGHLAHGCISFLQALSEQETCSAWQETVQGSSSHSTNHGIMYLCWVLQLFWTMKFQLPPVPSETSGCWCSDLGLLFWGGTDRSYADCPTLQGMKSQSYHTPLPTMYITVFTF